MKHARVIAQHRAPDRPAIQVAAGDAVTLGERDNGWPQFMWTTLTGGLGGWIPSALFDRDHGDATAQHDFYDTRELDAGIGEARPASRDGRLVVGRKYKGHERLGSGARVAVHP